jgi:hypothetical protein
MSDLVCPACGEADELTGMPEGDGIRITCGECGTDWLRDPSPRCERCDGSDLEPAVRAVVEKSRGSQMSIVGTQVIHLCRQCDAALLARYRDGRSPIMPDDLPTEP